MRAIIPMMLTLFVLGGCASKTVPVKAADLAPRVAPMPAPAVEKETAKPVGTPMWREACYRLTHPRSTSKPNVVELEVPIANETDTAVASCLEGFMVLPGNSADRASKCILGVDTQEAMFYCLQSALPKVSMDN